MLTNTHQRFTKQVAEQFLKLFVDALGLEPRLLVQTYPSIGLPIDYVRHCSNYTQLLVFPSRPCVFLFTSGSFLEPARVVEKIGFEPIQAAKLPSMAFLWTRTRLLPKFLQFLVFPSAKIFSDTYSPRQLLNLLNTLYVRGLR